MKKIILFLSIFFITHNFIANEILNNQIKLAKHSKIENTFSGDLNEKNSFHLIFTKNRKTKKYEVFSYLFDGENIQKLESFVNDKSYRVVSFHKKNDILSLLLSYKLKKKSFLKRVVYNLITKEKFESKPISHDNFSTSIRQKDKSILIYKDNDFLKISTFIGNAPSVDKKLLFEENADAKRFLKNNTITSIKTDEFVKNGATNVLRLYYENNILFFTRDSDEPLNISIIGISLNNKKANITQLLKLDLNNEKLIPKFLTFKNAGGEKFKKATSFFTSNKLFQLALSKKIGFINISDVNSGKSLNTISLDESISKQIKGNSEFQGIEKFLKNAGKNRYNATITANATKNNKVRVRVDYVDITYNYNYNWWWHHQQFMWQQQHQMFIQQSIQRNIPARFGPKQPNESAFEKASIKNEKRFFELLIDFNGKLLNEDLPVTMYKEVDKKAYIDKLDAIPNLSMDSSCFLENSFRYIAYNKKLKQFVIQTNTIK